VYILQARHHLNPCLWKEVFSQQRIRHFKILQSIYFAYDVGIISSYSNRNPGRTYGYRCTTLCAAPKVTLGLLWFFLCWVNEGETNYSNVFVWQQIFSKNNFHGADKQ